MKYMGVFMAGWLVAMAFIGPLSAQEAERREFSLKDSEGHVFWVGVTNEKDARLLLRSKSGKAWAVALDASRDGKARLRLWAPGSRERIKLQVDTDLAEVTLATEKWRRTLTAKVTGDEVSLRMRDKQTCHGAEITLSEKAARLELHAGQKLSVVVSDKGSDLSFRDSAGRARLTLGLSESGAPVLQTLSTDGRIVWQAPSGE